MAEKVKSRPEEKNSSIITGPAAQFSEYKAINAKPQSPAAFWALSPAAESIFCQEPM